MPETTKQDLFLEILPYDILKQVVQDFIPEDLVTISTTNKKIHKILNNDLFWKDKCQIHFPGIKSTSPSFTYRSLFISAYKKQYKGLSSRVTRLFSIIKQDDVYSLNQTEFSIDDLFNKDARNYSVIDWAAKKNNPIILNIIYSRVKPFFLSKDKKMDPHKKDSQKNSLLHWVARCNQIDEVDVCLLGGLDINAENTHKRSPLFLAMLYGHFKLVKFLYIEKFVKLDTWRGGILQVAAVHGQEEIVEFFLDHEEKEGRLNTEILEIILFEAVHHGYVNIVNLVVARVPNLNKEFEGEDFKKINVINSAIQRNDVVIANILLKHGYILDKSNDSHLNNAIKLNAKEMVVWLLLQEVKAKDAKPFQFALQNNFEEIARLLFDNAVNSSDFSQNYDDYKLAFLQAFKTMSLDFFKYGIQKLSLSVHAQDLQFYWNDDYCLNDTSILHIAVISGRDDIVDYLIKNGAMVNAVCDFTYDDYGGMPDISSLTRNYTALHCAVQFKRIKSAEILLKAGADISIKLEKKYNSSYFVSKLSAADFGLNHPEKVIRDIFVSNEKTKLIAEVKNYAEAREQDGRPYKKSVTLFGHTFNFGYSMTDKLAAGDKLIDYLAEKAEQSSLTEYLGALNDGDLGKIYQTAVKLKL